MFYCSKEHSKAVSWTLYKAHITLNRHFPITIQDWDSHKSSCKPPANEDQKFTALLFPVDGEEPRLSEIDFKIVKDDVGDIRHKINFTPLFGPNGCPKSYPVTNHGYYGAPLGRSLYIFINDNFFNDGSPLNKCIAHLAPGGHPWGGNVFVLRGRNPLYKYAQYYNAKMEDLAPAIQYLKDYGERVGSFLCIPGNDIDPL